MVFNPNEYVSDFDPDDYAGIPVPSSSIVKNQTTANMTPNDIARKAEQDRDEQEKKNRPSILKFTAEAIPNAAKEIVGVGKTVVQGAGLLHKFLQNPLKASYQAAKAVFNEPDKYNPIQFTKDVVLDTAKTFGWTPDRGFDVDTAIEKWKNEPISSITDLAIVGAVGKKAVTNGVKKAIDKVATKKALDRSGTKIAEMEKNLATPFETPGSNLLKNVEAIRPMSVKQLDSPDWYINTSRRLGNNLERLASEENRKLKKSVNAVKDDLVDVSKIENDTLAVMKEKNLVDDSGVIIPELNTPDINKFVKMIKNDKLTVGEAKKIIDTIDDKISWNPSASKEVQDGLKALRWSIRTELGEKVPGYNETASRIHDRIVVLGNRNKQLRNVGGKEQVGKNIFNSKEEIEELKRIFADNPSKRAPMLEADLNQLEGWQSWNSFFGTNQHYLPSFINVYGLPPIPVKGITRPIYKRYTKARVSAPVQIAKSAFPSAKQVSVGVGAGSKLQSLYGEGNNQ